jgi:hypothetical protein
VSEHDEPEGYDGEVTVRLDGEPEQRAHAALVARFDPLAGSIVWTGRLSVALAPRREVEITTPHGIGRAQVTERDVWGNTRVTGLGRPPFPVELLEVSGEPAEE